MLHTHALETQCRHGRTLSAAVALTHDSAGEGWFFHDCLVTKSTITRFRYIVANTLFLLSVCRRLLAWLRVYLLLTEGVLLQQDGFHRRGSLDGKCALLDIALLFCIISSTSASSIESKCKNAPCEEAEAHRFRVSRTSPLAHANVSLMSPSFNLSCSPLRT